MIARLIRYLWVLAVWLLGLPAQAQEVPERLGVAEAIRIAEVQNPAVNQLRAQIAARRGERLTTFGLYAPQIAYAREGIAGSGYGEQRLVVSQTFDFPLESYYRYRRVQTEQDALESRLDAALRDLTANVKSAYTRLLYAQEVVHLREQEFELARALVKAVSTRLEVGEASELDLMKAELQDAQARDNLDAALRAFQQERYALFNTIGLDPEAQRYEIVFPDTLQYFETNIAQEAVMAHLPGQPELFAATQRVEAAEYGVKQSKSAALPRLQVSYGPQDFGGGYDYQTFEVGISVPVWFWLGGRGAVRQARAEAVERSWAREAVALDLKKQVEQTWHSYETSLRTIARFTEAVQGRADELLALTREGYQLGELDLLTLLDTQRTYLDSQLRYYNALRDYYLDLIQLERFLPQELVFVSE